MITLQKLKYEGHAKGMIPVAIDDMNYIPR